VVGSGDPATALNNDPGMNFSSANLDDASTDNPFDDARAHRAIVVGDFIAMGYSYTTDQALARYTDMENYDFLVRTSADGGQAWDTAQNLSTLPKNRSVKEPRLVGTPSSGPACPSGDPADPTTIDVTECQNKNLFYVAWGTELNQYEAVSTGSVDLDLYISRSTDRGASYEPVTRIVQGSEELIDASDTHNGESQLRTKPDGNDVYVSWMQTSLDGKEAAYTSGIPVDASAFSSSSGGGGGGGGGCAYQSSGKSDPVLPVLVFIGLVYARWKRVIGRRH
jgi:hypothetical protein